MSLLTVASLRDDLLRRMGRQRKPINRLSQKINTMGFVPLPILPFSTFLANIALTRGRKLLLSVQQTLVRRIRRQTSCHLTLQFR